MENSYTTPEIEMIDLNTVDILTSSFGIHTPIVPTEDDEWLL